MQPKRPFLPEFDGNRHDAKAGPMRWPRHRAFGKPPRKLLHPPFELGAAGERLRLIRGPGADLTVARPAREIGVSLLPGDQFDRTPDDNIAVQRLPHKTKPRVTGWRTVL